MQSFLEARLQNLASATSCKSLWKQHLLNFHWGPSRESLASIPKKADIDHLQPPWDPEGPRPPSSHTHADSLSLSKSELILSQSKYRMSGIWARKIAKLEKFCLSHNERWQALLPPILDHAGVLIAKIAISLQYLPNVIRTRVQTGFRDNPAILDNSLASAFELNEAEAFQTEHSKTSLKYSYFPHVWQTR